MVVKFPLHLMYWLNQHDNVTTALLMRIGCTTWRWSQH